MNSTLFVAIPSPSPTTPSSGSGWTVTVLPVIISVISAVGLSGLITAFYVSRQQRIKDTREAWLTATDGFLTAASRSLTALQDLEPRKITQGHIQRMLFVSRRDLLEEYAFPLRERSLEISSTAAIEAIEKLRRVQLLFGPKANLAFQAVESVNCLRNGLISINAYYNADSRHAADRAEGTAEPAPAELAVTKPASSPEPAPGAPTQLLGTTESATTDPTSGAPAKPGTIEPAVTEPATPEPATPEPAATEPATPEPLASMLPGTIDLLVLAWKAVGGWKTVGNMLELIQSSSVEDEKEKALKIYKDSVVKAEESLDAFVGSVWVELYRLQKQPWLRQRPVKR